MAVIYATLIVKGKKTYAQVPEKIKPQVKAGSDRPGVRRSDHGGVSHGINHAVHICALGFHGCLGLSLYCFPEHIINYPNN